MDLNEYLCEHLMRERVADLLAASERARLVKQVATPRRSLRAFLGVGLIRIGSRLLREEYALPPAP